MYKVFLNASIICFVPSNDNYFEGMNVHFFDYKTFDQLMSRIHYIEKYPVNECLIVVDPTMDLWKEFKDNFFELPAAGGLVTNTKGQWLFIKRLGFWDLPKGKIDPNETEKQAAIREVEEECGLSDLHVIKRLDSTFHMYRSPYKNSRGKLVFKETSWFLMESFGDENLISQIQESIEEVRWLDTSEIEEAMNNTYPSIKDFVNKSLAII